jgi:serine/threonine protein kinase
MPELEATAKYWLSTAKTPLSDFLRICYDHEGFALLRAAHHNVIPYVDHGTGFLVRGQGENPDNKHIAHAVIMGSFPGRDLGQILQAPVQVFNDVQCRTLFRSLVVTVIDLQATGIFHCELKASNILAMLTVVTPEIRLIDFGWAQFGTSQSPYLREHWLRAACFRAPEMYYQNAQHNEKTEVFALGCILFELYFCRPPCDYATHTDRLYQHLWNNQYPLYWDQVFRCCPPLPNPPNSPELVDLLNLMLCPNPVERLTFGEIIAHPFLQAPHV